jgi:hypothetical protein
MPGQYLKIMPLPLPSTSFPINLSFAYYPFIGCCIFSVTNKASLNRLQTNRALHKKLLVKTLPPSAEAICPVLFSEDAASGPCPVADEASAHLQGLLYFAPASLCEGFVVEKVALGQVFLRVLSFSPASIIRP